MRFTNHDPHLDGLGAALEDNVALDFEPELGVEFVVVLCARLEIHGTLFSIGLPIVSLITRDESTRNLL